ncbi:dinitrogenase iron-molybdenum cofactor biosynthesis protein [Pseudomonas sp. GCM10022188]|uniref:dinitrogenase iron-molybdenum cofactor biosynthesis protein n=1 Tax=Pseudomonas TaxID=286 RepID=UPI001E6467ED|nr:dinitrogenase iron-molybdenum cofactor biosynthesis protein [Pseudomonas oryzagri]MCC6076252.1 dinitrogenase iron-molybdenum cofactor biosynthesis protein [Pseudomonas oryzagri]
MDSPVNLSREAALRIALAARALPDVPLRKLLEILQERVDAPLTEQTLRRVTVIDLKIGLAGGEDDVDLVDTPMAALKEAVRILWGEVEPGTLPQTQDLAELQSAEEKSIRVAIASNSDANLDGHFGSCQRFLVYQVSASARVLVDVRATDGADQAEDRNGYRRDLIRDCQVLYAVTIGGPAASKVVRSGIYPILRIEGGSADAILDELQAVMASAPPPWLAKLLGRGGERRLRYETTDEVA